MKRVTCVLALAAALVGAGPRVSAQVRDERFTVPLTDPGRPVTLDIGIYAGIVTITATETKAIVVEATGGGFGARGGRAGRAGRAARGGRGAALADTTGLTRLSQPTQISVEESNNVVTLRGPSNYRVDLTVQVPARTNLRLKKGAKIAGSNMGAITVKGLDGDLEIDTSAGAVTLTDVSGSVVAHSTSGSVTATVRRVNPDRPMAFTSYSGSVDVTLPSSVKAEFLLRSDRRDVYTNFDLNVRSGGSRRTDNQEVRATANGGGPEIELRTYSGYVYLRRGN